MASAALTASAGIGAAAPSVLLPEGACDCHVHIIGPQDRYPMVPGRAYTPPQSTVAELLALRARLGLSRTVLIQPSFYGTDNRAMLDALAQLGDSARGIAVLDPGVTDEELRSLDQAGVRGIRINVESGGSRNPQDVISALGNMPSRLAALGWHIQIYAALSVIGRIAPAIAAWPVPVVFDHFGMPDASQGTEQQGFGEMLGLLRTGKGFVKLSAPYRISRQNPEAVEPFAKALIARTPDRLLWASDWPHTDRAPGARTTDISPFRTVDDRSMLELFLRWCPDAASRHAILVETPKRLYRFS